MKISKELNFLKNLLFIRWTCNLLMLIKDIWIFLVNVVCWTGTETDHTEIIVVYFLCSQFL